MESRDNETTVRDLTYYGEWTYNLRDDAGNLKERIGKLSRISHIRFCPDAERQEAMIRAAESALQSAYVLLDEAAACYYKERDHMSGRNQKAAADVAFLLSHLLKTPGATRGEVIASMQEAGWGKKRTLRILDIAEAEGYIVIEYSSRNPKAVRRHYVTDYGKDELGRWSETVTPEDEPGFMDDVEKELRRLKASAEAKRRIAERQEV